MHIVSNISFNFSCATKFSDYRYYLITDKSRYFYEKGTLSKAVILLSNGLGLSESQKPALRVSWKYLSIVRILILAFEQCIKVKKDYRYRDSSACSL